MITTILRSVILSLCINRRGHKVLPNMTTTHLNNTIHMHTSILPPCVYIHAYTCVLCCMCVHASQESSISYITTLQCNTTQGYKTTCTILQQSNQNEDNLYAHTH